MNCKHNMQYENFKSQLLLSPQNTSGYVSNATKTKGLHALHALNVSFGELYGPLVRAPP